MARDDFQSIIDDLTFLDRAAIASLPVLIQGMTATSQNIDEQMVRCARAAFDIAERMLAEKDLRHQARLDGRASR